MDSPTLSPITHEYVLRCSPTEAFSRYTEQAGQWWDPGYTANPETFETIVIEPAVGGRVYAVHGDLGEHDWGLVTVWEPGQRLVHTFTLAQDPQHPSEVSVAFAALDDGCALRLSHGGWTEANAAVRAKFSDWPVMLDRFAALADAQH